MKRIILVAAMILISCTAVPPIESYRHVRDISKPPFVPVRILFTSDQKNKSTLATYFEVFRDEIISSGMFLTVSGENDEWPFSIFLKFDKVSENTSSDDLKGLFSALTLFVVPAKEKSSYSLDVAVQFKDSTLKEYHYVEKVETSESIIKHMDEWDREVIANMLNIWFRDFENDHPIPRVNEIQQDQKAQQS